MYVLNVEEGLKVLVISPHSDDIELGCGATVMWLVRERSADVYYRVLCAESLSVTRSTPRVNRRAESRNAAKMLGISNVDIPEDPPHYETQIFPDTQFPEERVKIHKYIESIKLQVDPQLVIVPSLDDAHQDHTTVAETALRIFREGQNIWHYEIIQFNRGRFVPNLFVDVSEEVYWEDTSNRQSYAERKNYILQTCFPSQKGKSYFDTDVIMGNMHTRGSQCGRTVKYAEAFQSRVSVFDYQGFRRPERIT